MRTYEVDFYKKETDEKGRVKWNFAGTVEVTMHRHEKLPVAAKAYRQATSFQQLANKLTIRRVR